jgi:outer membrane lipoprotein-sorting protein
MEDTDKHESLKRVAGQAVPDDLDLWPQIRSRALAAHRHAPATRSHRRLLAGLAAAIVLALVAGVASQLWNPAQPASAQAILDQAQASASGPAVVRTYHLLMSRLVPAKGNAAITTEIWYGGKDRQRSLQQVKDPSGAIVSGQETVFNGTDAWISTTQGGSTQIIHTQGTKWTEPAEDPAQQHSLTDLLTQYSAKSCMVAQLQGEATVAGRATYVIRATPKPDGCTSKVPSGSKVGPDQDAIAAAKAKAAAGGQLTAADKAKLRAAGAGKVGGPGYIGEMLVWVDKVSYLPLKTEVRDQSGAMIDGSEVTSVEYNVAFPDSTFTYAPPAGAKVFSYNGGTGADVKAAMCADPANTICKAPKK